MSSAVVSPIPKAHPTVRDPWFFRISLITLASAFLLLFVVIPVWTVFHEALAKGIGTYFAAFQDSAGRSAIGLTLLVAAIAVPCNLIFGLCASWAIAKFQFPGKSLLVTFIDLPFAVSPVVSGLIYVLLFGSRGWFGPLLNSWNVQIIFAVPGIVLATIFVTSAVLPIRSPSTSKFCITNTTLSPHLRWRHC
jgi:sulfate transport system permease protein